MSSPGIRPYSRSGAREAADGRADPHVPATSRAQGMHASTTTATHLAPVSAPTSSWIVVAGLAAAIVCILVIMLLVNRRDRHRLAAVADKLPASESRLRELAETVPAGI